MKNEVIINKNFLDFAANNKDYAFKLLVTVGVFSAICRVIDSCNNFSIVTKNLRFDFNK